MNTQFAYMYRDGSNYKSFGSCVFTGVIKAAGKMRAFTFFYMNNLFVAHQIGVPEVFHDSWPMYGDDHCYHEAIALNDTTAEPTDARTIQEFISDLQRIGSTGWEAFDPQERIGPSLRT